MKYKRLDADLAKRMIVEGKGNAFSIVKIGDTQYTIYHRQWEDKYYEIAELETPIDDTGVKTFSVFYEFDVEEVKQLLGKDYSYTISEDEDVSIKPYLIEEEIKRAKMCIYGIDDNMQAIRTEILTNKKPYKSYLMEKLKAIKTDLNCLIAMCEGDDTNER